MRLVIYQCELCGKVFERKEFPGVRPISHHFCSLDCARKARSIKFAEMNKELNPTRMTKDVRDKLRNYRLKNPEERKSYTKVYGRHEHRIVAEQKLGRKLLPGEVVHHIDGNKQNNSPDNLMVFKNQKEHAKWHKEHDNLLNGKEKGTKA